MNLSNQAMIIELEQRLRQTLAGRIGDFQLLLQDKGLILKGCAPSFYLKQLAQHLTMEATTVPILANLIEVANPEPL